MKIKNKIYLLIIASIIIACLPITGIDRYYIRFFTYIFLWSSLATSWNISSGYTGYIDFGPVVYFGIGSYSSGILMTMLKIPFFISTFIGGMLSLFIAIIIGLPTLRLKGAYFAIATFAFAESMKQAVLSFDLTFNTKIFMGSHGIFLPINSNYMFFYYLMFLVALLSIIAALLLENSKIGLALKAINESEEASQMIGINTTKIKLIAYIIGAFFIGINGGIYAYWVSYITPDDVFNVYKTVQMVIMTLLGGIGTFIGPTIGAIFFTSISEVLGVEFIEDYLIIVGFVVIFIILIEPTGIYGLTKWKKYWKSKI